MEIHEHGNGSTTVMIVPGGPSLPVAFYRELMDGLARLARVVTFRQPGVYPATDEDFPRTIEAHAEQLEEALGEVSARRGRGEAAPFLLGHSIGGAVVLEALCRGANVSGAIVMNGFASGRMVERGISARVAALPREFHERYPASAGTNPEAINELLGEFWFPRHFCRAPMPESFTTALARLNPAYMEHFLGPSLFEPDGAVMEWDREPDLGRICVPVLYLGSSYDYYRPEDVEAMHRATPDSRLWMSERASHTPWIEDPENTLEAIRAFLEPQ